MFRRSPLHQKLRIMHGMQVCHLDEAGVLGVWESGPPTNAPWKHLKLPASCPHLLLLLHHAILVVLLTHSIRCSGPLTRRRCA